MLNYAKEATYEKMQLLDEETITDCLNIVVEDLTVHEITDREICDKVLHQEMNDDEDDTGEGNRNKDDIPIDKCINLTEELICGLETKSIITEVKIMQLYKLLDMLQCEKFPKNEATDNIKYVYGIRPLKYLI